MGDLKTVRGLAVRIGEPHSLQMVSIPLPEIGPDDVEINVLEAGICGTDREIIDGQFGTPPFGESTLVLGHETIGEIAAIGVNVTGFAVGDLVSATVRRGCGCPNCAAGESDYCTTMQYAERGIHKVHGFWTESFVENAANLVHIPNSLRTVGVMVEPASVIEKAWRVAKAVQARFPVWEPKTAVVFGAGPIGLLQAMLLRQHEMDVTVVARRPASEAPAASIVNAIGGHYVSVQEGDVLSLKAALPNIDIIVDCSGSSQSIATGLQILGIAGVMVLLSNTGGSTEITLPLDQINVGWVGGNKTVVGSVNSSAADFRAAIADMQEWQRMWPGVLERLITHRLPDLESGIDLMESTHGAIKAVIEIGS